MFSLQVDREGGYECVGEKEFTFCFVKLESQQDHGINISETGRGKG